MMPMVHLEISDRFAPVKPWFVIRPTDHLTFPQYLSVRTDAMRKLPLGDVTDTARRCATSRKQRSRTGARSHRPNPDADRTCCRDDENVFGLGVGFVIPVPEEPGGARVTHAGAA